ncbi:GNAT family N-acetyltransferase [Lactiplantibacillus garii]|uniref:GNAT family N-acetyltransferase n=1 Tax=Lactiplantibacillus garii TaxID=2306423 RepID=A0A3R8KJZ7_9LACO|nr:GNAT family N-acetyltransferase [Lactiplantibacillus garii]RRK11339.1 GNAT family N-acetyltransferase [Lactiplantibacillus garii]
MIKRVLAADLPRDLLLAADPDWQVVRQYLNTGECYAAWQQGRLVGLMVLTRLNDRAREVKNIAVVPNYQHRGVARRLLTMAIQRCRADRKCEELWIGTGNSSLRQLAIYQRAGFEMRTVWVNYFVDNYAEPIFENGLRCKSMVRLCITTK